MYIHTHTHTLTCMQHTYAQMMQRIRILMGKEVYLHKILRVTLYMYTLHIYTYMHVYVYTYTHIHTYAQVMQTIRILIGKEALLVRDAQNNTIAHMAGSVCGVESMQYICQELGSEIFHVANADGDTAVIEAVQKDLKKCLMPMWELLGAKLFTEPCCKGHSLLVIAASQSDHCKIMEVAADLAGPNVLRVISKEGNNLAHISASHGHMEICQFLLKVGLRDLFEQVRVLCVCACVCVCEYTFIGLHDLFEEVCVLSLFLLGCNWRNAC
jgi:hypothetical protein